MSKAAYFDCISGASGDMILGALVDAGLPFETLRKEIRGLALPSQAYEIEASQVKRAGLAATHVSVSVREAAVHRSLGQVLEIVEGSALPRIDRDKAKAVFQALGEAEAKVHGTDPALVELHEVGSVDALVDVTGAIAGLRLLEVDQVFSSPLPLGHGRVSAQHGSLPVPAPATLNLLTAKKAPTTGGEGPAMELVTPTGAALLTTLAEFKRPEMSLEASGFGAGGRDLADFPNVLRLWLGGLGTEQLPRMRVLETNLDDMTPEMLGYVQERLLASGAADVWFTSIQMKKNRPAVMLSLIAKQDLEASLADILLRETSTLGVRVREVERYEADREIHEIQSSLGSVRVKVKKLQGAQVSFAPEYEDCKRIAEERGLTLPQVYRVVTAEAENLLSSGR